MSALSARSAASPDKVPHLALDAQPVAAPTVPRPLLRIPEAASFLNMTVAALHAWRRNGKGPRFVRLGSSVRYRPEDLEAFIEAGLCTSVTEANSKARTKARA